MRLDFSDAPFKVVVAFGLLKYRYLEFFQQLAPVADRVRLAVEFDNYDFSFEQITEVFAACERAGIPSVFRLDADLRHLPGHYWEAARRKSGIFHALTLLSADERSHDETASYLSNFEQYRNASSSFIFVQETLGKAIGAGVNVVMRTAVTRANLSQIGNIYYRFMDERNLRDWELYHLVVPYRVGVHNLQLESDDFEDLFNFYYLLTAENGVRLRIEEAAHYRRFFIQKMEEERMLLREGKYKRDISGSETTSRIVAAVCRDTEAEFDPPKITSAREFGFRGVGAGLGECYVNGMGEMFPSRFVDTRSGNIFVTGLLKLYRESDAFLSLRNKKALSGKCGLCGFKQICGGSRARAILAKKSPAAEDPACNYGK